MDEKGNVTDRIKKFNEPLLQDKVKLKYEAMAKNMYGFYRGTCHLFYEDLQKVVLPDSPLVWICGDLHLENFGSYKGENRLVYFDLNDFDEGILAPALWELARMITSIIISFDALKIERKKALRMAELFLKKYASILGRGKARYIETRIAEGIIKTFLDTVRKRKQKQLIKRRTTKIKGKLTLLADGKKQEKLDDNLRAELISHINHWIKNNDECPYNYKAVDVAFRIAGTGSLGLKRYVALLQGTNNPDEFLLLDMKASRQSALKPYLDIPQPAWESQAIRIAAIQQRMQNVAPAFFSTSKFKDDTYMMQEMQPIEDNIDFNLIKNEYRNIYKAIDDMAMLTASCQLRSSGRQGSGITDDLIAFGNNTEWQKEIITYAVNYSMQVKNYYEQFLKDYKGLQ